MDEEMKKEDSTINPTADVAYWINTPHLPDDLTFPNPSSPTPYGNDQALPSPSNLPLDIQAGAYQY